ncbi:MAG: hypothetical protein E7329_02730 [Clostridiales bacterium]|nr:hypothetical protein [Clostridiales bacterium]
MKRLLALLLSVLLLASCFSGALADEKKTLTDDPINLTILTTRVSQYSTDVDTLWFFKYIEWWLKDQGYDATVTVQQTMEAGQQIPLLLATDSLPDLIWGIQLSNNNAVTFGQVDGVIMDWAPYLNEETMPNIMRLFKNDPSALAASTCNNGGVYSLPYMVDRGWGQAAGNQCSYVKLFVNTEWLKAVNMENPDTIEEFIDVLRAFKKEIKVEGQEVVPAVSLGNLLEQYLWANMGYYSGGAGKYGTNFCIKNGEVWYPAATADYETFIKIMNTLYTEKLISEDYYTMDNNTVRGISQAGAAGVVGDYGMQYVPDYTQWTQLKPFLIGETAEAVYATVNPTYTVGKIWASASTKHPEVLAQLLDYVYSPEGSVMYYYGPMKGQDPLGILSGWYYDENGVIMSEEVIKYNKEKGTDMDHFALGSDLVHSTIYTGNTIDYSRYAKVMAGLDSTLKTEIMKDAVTGQDVEIVWKVDYVPDNADGYLRHDAVKVWGDCITTVKLPSVYMTEEEALEAVDLQTVIYDYVVAESAKFITGLRPLDEIDDFQEELKKLGVEKYVQMYRDAYKTYMDSVFGK